MRNLRLFFVLITLILLSNVLWSQDVSDDWELVWSGGYHPEGLWDVVSGFDLDQDGLQEIAVSNDSAGANVILYEVTAMDGNDNYHKVWQAHMPDAAYGFTLCNIPADIDGDGLGEIIVGVKAGTSNGVCVYIYEWDGVMGSNNYPLAAAWDLNNMLGDQNGAMCIAAYDVDNDGRQELIVSQRDAKIIIVEETSRDLTFPNWNIEFEDTTSSYGARSIECGDFDNDGLGDIAIAEHDFSGFLLVESTSENTYELQYYDHLTPEEDGVAFQALKHADLDHDNYAELYYPSNNGRFFVITNTGDIKSINETNIHRIFKIEGAGAFRGHFLFDPEIDKKLENPHFITSGYRDYYIWDMELTGNVPTDSLSWYLSKIEIPYMAVNELDIRDVSGGYDYDGDGKNEIFAITQVDTGNVHDMLFVLEQKMSSDIVINEHQQPESYKLYQNYPNPFNPETNIVYDVLKAGEVTLTIFNAQGKLVKTLIINEFQTSGQHNINWDGTNNNNESVTSGIYICQIKVEDFTSRVKMVLIR